MGLFDDLGGYRRDLQQMMGQSPDIYGNLLGATQPRIDTSLPSLVPTNGMPLDPNSGIQPPQAEPPSLLSSLGSLFNKEQPQGKMQDWMEQMGIPQPKAQWKTMLPAVLTQVGMALLQPPGPQRAAVFAQIPATMLAVQKADYENRQNRAMLGIYAKMKGADKDKYGNQVFVNTNTGEKRYAKQGEVLGPEWEVWEKTATEKNPFVRNVQMGDKNVTQQYNRDTQQWETIGEGPKFAPQTPVTILPPNFTGNAPPGARLGHQPQRPQPLWHPTTTTNEKGETVPAQMNIVTGEVRPISQFGKKKQTDDALQQFLNPGGAPAPAPTQQMGTPIGKTPDGRTVYQDANGKKFTMQ